jgi:3-oxo-5-alpha-steroid 4-dehydrogenase 1
MISLFQPEYFNAFLITMAAIAVIVFIALHFIGAGYGIMYTRQWGPAIPNRIGWVLMEAPVFFAMAALWLLSDRATEIAPLVMFLLFELHYFQRSFIFPLLIKGNSRMPLSIIVMGIIFNTFNALMQGGWIFYVSAPDYYPTSWLYSWQFIVGTAVFFAGMAINIHSDHIIRHLRKPGDTKHYLPRGGMFRYVTSANYFGEFVEWCGFALLTWSWAGAVFALWTFANLAPRAGKIRQRYIAEFGDEVRNRKLHRIIPFIY